MKRIQLRSLTLAITAVIGLSACTDLEIEETDSFISEGFQGLADPQSALDQLYNQAGGQLGDQANTYALNVVTSDEQLIPTRGADWGDNGRWRKLHQHEWGLEETDIITPFDQWNANQLLASQILDERTAAPADVAAQAHFMRAYSMYIILDLYGQVPFRDTQESSSTVPIVLSGAEAVTFILADLDAAIAGLPAEPAGTGNQDRASKAAARLLKAKVLLNRNVFEAQLADNLPAAASVADMQEVVNLVDQIAADGYALQQGYFDIFTDATDTETIWYITSGNTGNRIFNGLHYNSTSNGGGGWNGFSTLAEFYDLFEGDPNQNRYDGNIEDQVALDGQEERRGGVPNVGVLFTEAPGTGNGGEDNPGGVYETGSNVGLGFLIGQQFDLPPNTPLQDRQGAPLAFTREFLDGDGNPNLINNNEITGIRVQKYQARFNGGFTGHLIIMRYADAHLMKAEAILRGASPTTGGDATALVNELRNIRGTSEVFGSVDEQTLLDERGRELYTEGWRRNDMIRFGQYGRAWEFKGSDQVNNRTRQLFPIPLPQLLANPNLVQNPGYGG